MELVARDDEEEEQLKLAIAARLQEMCDALIADNPELTEGEIAIRCGVSPKAFSLYITGERKLPYRAMVAAWREFGAEPGWFMAGEARFNDAGFEQKRRRLLLEPPKPRRGKRRS
jgi:hypothetical protein